MPKINSKFAKIEPSRDACTIRISFLTRAMLPECQHEKSRGQESLQPDNDNSHENNQFDRISECHIHQSSNCVSEADRNTLRSVTKKTGQWNDGYCIHREDYAARGPCEMNRNANGHKDQKDIDVAGEQDVLDGQEESGDDALLSPGSSFILRRPYRRRGLNLRLGLPCNGRRGAAGRCYRGRPGAASRCGRRSAAIGKERRWPMSFSPCPGTNAVWIPFDGQPSSGACRYLYHNCVMGQYG